MVVEGQQLLTDALIAVDQTDGRFWEAELCRLQGELLLTDASVSLTDVEACLGQAFSIAQRQQAKSLELKASMSLCRLWRQQGKLEEARDLLRDFYNGFTEGFDTTDLQEVKTLLAELDG